MLVNDDIISDDIEKSNVLNKYFIDTSSLDPGAELNSQFLLEVNSIFNDDSLTDVLGRKILDTFVVNPCEVLNVIKKLNVDKAVGPDGINNRVLKICGDQLAEPLTYIFNKCISSGYFPDEWKLANVTPIFKKGNHQLMSNYRPVSLLSLVSKVFERILYNKLYDYCYEHNILTPKNSGFKKKDSTINQLIHLTHLVYKGLDDEKKIALVFIDITKAIDKIWHKGLVYKLYKIGIRGKFLKLIRSYLSGRNQRVVLNGSMSEFLEILSGVPQGSILGPLLFLIYLNDIVDNIDCPMYLFADDTSLLSIGENWRDVELELNRALVLLDKWAVNWLIGFNPLKTHYLMVSNKNISDSTLSLKLNSVLLSRVFEHKHLGVVLNGSFTWSNHIEYIYRKASRSIGHISRSKHSFNRSTLIKLYVTLVRPIIEYGSVLYDNLSIKDNNRLELLNRRSAIICSGAISRTETRSLLGDLGWNTLKQRRLISKLLMFYKIFSKQAPGYLLDDFITTQHVETRKVTRSVLNAQIHIPFCRTNKFKYSFFPSSIVAWNGLPLEARIMDSLAKFKKYLNSKFNPPDKFFDYNLFSGSCSRIVTQARLGLCSLNENLFKYNLTDNPLCPNCASLETLEHFLFNCTFYQDARSNYLKKLKLYLPLLDTMKLKELARICVAGLDSLSFEFNYGILLTTAEYIRFSKRFVIVT